MREDASFASFYLIGLALGVLLVSTHGSNLDLLHLLFGSILAVDNMALILMGGIATSSLLLLAVIYRPLVVECFDPGFLRAVQRSRRARPHAVSGTRRPQPRRRVSSARHVDGRGADDAASRRGALLGAGVVVAECHE